MRNIVAIMNRELLAIFLSPVAYVVIAGFLLITGILAVDAFRPGQPASLRGVFGMAPYLLAIVVPAISMRSLSEEYRGGTIETLMTAPLSDAEMVIGKYLASLLFYVIMIAMTLAHLALMMAYGNPDLGAAATAYLGLLLVGVAFVAIGTFASSLTSNQIVAWMIAAVPLIVFVWLGGYLDRYAEGWWREALRSVNVVLHLSETNRGLISTDALVFFLATGGFFVFLAIKVVESRRWR